MRLRFQSESALVQQIDAEITEYLASTANVENSTAAEPQAVRFYSDYENCKWGFNFQNISFRDPKTPFLFALGPTDFGSVIPYQCRRRWI